MNSSLSALSDAELLQSTRFQVARACEVDAELLLLLGEIDARQLFLGRAFPSMFVFCTGELGMSENVAYNRITVARLARRLPRVLDFVRTGRCHLTGLRILERVLTDANVEEVLVAAAGKSKREIEELLVSVAPKPPVPTSIRKLPERSAPLVEEPALLSLPLPLPEAAPVAPPAPVARKPEVEPLSAETYQVKFTASRELKTKLEKAEELMRHRVGRGNLVAVIERALDLLIEDVTKERFGLAAKPRGTVAEAERREVVTRHIPAAIRREVYARDNGQCTFVSDDGRRCEERGGLEFEHTEGFARTGRHTAAELTLHCRAHNQHAADKLYGRDFMQAKRRSTFPGKGELAAPH